MITDTCTCGAKFHLHDKGGYLEERYTHKQWLDAHVLCRTVESSAHPQLNDGVLDDKTIDELMILRDRLMKGYLRVDKKLWFAMKAEMCDHDANKGATE